MSPKQLMKVGVWLLAFGVTVLLVMLLTPAKESTPPAAIAPGPVAAAKAKPICASPVNPAVAAPTDCEPPGLPPDPGEAGKATPDGLCATPTGALEPCDPEKHPERIRADVQRWIITEWGHSPLAVKSLEIQARFNLLSVHYRDSLGPDETRKRFAADVMRQGACTANLATQETLGTSHKLKLQVLNTPERQKRASDFNYMFHGGWYPAFEGTPNEACGFDVEALAATEGKVTLADQYRAEAAQREEGK